MKNIHLIFLSLSLLWSCSKAGTIQFCEGVTPKGDGVNCGKKFESGDVSALINGEEPFGVKEIMVQVTRKRENKSEVVEKITINVLPDKQTVTANLSFYSAGTYSVTARKNNAVIGSGEIEIVDY